MLFQVKKSLFPFHVKIHLEIRTIKKFKTGLNCIIFYGESYIMNRGLVF